MHIPFPSRALIVSCQAQPDSALHGPDAMARMAREALRGGAQGIRANGVADVAAIRAVVDVPIIGINKLGDRDGVFITPSAAAAGAVIDAGADLVAIDGTRRARPDGTSLSAQIDAIHQRYGVPVMADVDDYEAGLAAADAGADLVATTLSGYTGQAVPNGPDLELVARLAAAIAVPIVAEGRIWTPDEARAAFDAGAHAVVVGTAITNPSAITARFRRAAA